MRGSCAGPGRQPRIQERPPDALTPDEERAVRSVPEPYGFIVRLGLATGLRWSEMARAQASEVQDGMLVVSNTKSRKVRRVPLPPDLLEELRFKIGPLLPRLVGFHETGASLFQGGAIPPAPAAPHVRDSLGRGRRKPRRTPAGSGALFDLGDAAVRTAHGRACAGRGTAFGGNSVAERSGR